MAGLRDFADEAGDVFNRVRNSASEAYGRMASNRAMNSGASVSEGAMDPAEFERTFGRPAAGAPQAAEGTANLGAGRAAANASRGYGVGLRAGRFLSRAAPAAAGAVALSDFGEHKIADPDVDSSAGGTLGYLRQGDFGKVGQSLSKGALEAGMDLMGGVAKLVPGHFIEDRLHGMRDALGNQLTVDGKPQGEPQAQPLPGGDAASAANPTDQRLEDGTQAAPLSSGQELPGAPGVRKFTDARGTAYSNVPGESTPAGPGVSSLNFSEGLARQAHANDIYNSIGESQRGSTVIPGVNAPLTQYQQETAARNATVHGTPSNRDMSRPALRARELDQADRHLGLEARGQDLTHEVGMAGANNVRRGQDLNFESSIYGTDMGGKNARARLNYEIGKDQRDFTQKRAEFEAGRDDKTFEQRNAGAKALHEQISGLVAPTTDKDGKQVPDTQTATRYSNGLTQLMAARRPMLEERARQGDKDAAASLKQLDRGQLPADEVSRYVAGMKAADLARQYHTGAFTPWGGTGYSGDQPLEKLVKKSQLNGDVYEGYVTDPRTGKQAKVAEIPARAVEKTNADFVGGQHRIDLNSLIKPN